VTRHTLTYSDFSFKQTSLLATNKALIFLYTDSRYWPNTLASSAI